MIGHYFAFNIFFLIENKKLLVHPLKKFGGEKNAKKRIKYMFIEF